MSALDRLAAGAPGVFSLPPEPLRALSGVRLDACAFVGVAPRGPARVPLVDNTPEHGDDWRMCDPLRPRQRSVAIQVDSFDAYRRRFGAFEGPGLLPYAVASFFEQGGREAWIVRIVHADPPGAPGDGVAHGLLPALQGSPRLLARNEGSWGNGLRVELALRCRALLATPLPPSSRVLQLSAGTGLPVGSLLRLRLDDGSQALRFVSAVDSVGDAQAPRRWLRAELESATPRPIVGAELVEAELSLQDGAGAGERFAALGLHRAHPRWMATVLCRESELVWPDFAWAGDRLLPATPMRLDEPQRSAPFAGGADRWQAITHEDFFDPGWGPLAEQAASGLQALATLQAVTQIVLPDLYQAAPLPPQADVSDASLAGPDFAPCVELPAVPPTPENASELPGLALDPCQPADLARITELLLRVQDFVETTRNHIALLDVPPGLQPRQVLALRSHFNSAYCALYHPWPLIARDDDGRAALVELPPAAAAAGIVAACELERGIAQGPANRLVLGAVKLRQQVSPAEHALLHPQGINVLLQEPAGIRLSAARSLSLDPAWRQLSVRRLMLMLRRTLLEQMQWAAFEPHTPALCRQLVHLLTALLRRLYRFGSFKGATEEQAFFVQCDDSLNPPWRVDNGQLLAHIGVAPTEPLEFIVLQLSRAGDGTLTLESA